MFFKYQLALRLSGSPSDKFSKKLLCMVSLAMDVLKHLPFVPNEQQALLVAAMCSFVGNGADRDVFVLNGYAGTGKTSVVGALIKTLAEHRKPVVLLAPTGRAAKVASALAGFPASTIHRKIFRPLSSDPSGASWYLAKNEHADTLFIIDEASLISDSQGGGESLLRQVVRYIYSARGCRMMLVGDEAQLPPVGQTESTAMNPARLRRLGLNPICGTLDIPARQAADSGIVHNATIVRQLLFNSVPGLPAALDVTGFPEIAAISSVELAEVLADSYAAVGEEDTIIVTRSNRRASNFNRAIRRMVMYAEDPIQRGDRLIVARNDYYWMKANKAAKHSPLIANGDTALVTWVGRSQKVYGRYFTEVELQLSGGMVVSAQVMLRSLVCEGPSIPREEMERFYNHVMASAEGSMSEKMAVALDDPYYNALQVKYAYCVTCHKAQGGQWRHVYIDMGGIAPENFTGDFYRWLYTALTRATEKVFLINPTLPLR